LHVLRERGLGAKLSRLEVAGIAAEVMQAGNARCLVFNRSRYQPVAEEQSQTCPQNDESFWRTRARRCPGGRSRRSYSVLRCPAV
jgi:hypothetical protein